MAAETGSLKIMLLQVHIIHDAPAKTAAAIRKGLAILATGINAVTSTDYRDLHPIAGGLKQASANSSLSSFRRHVYNQN
jgi:hypothetical protein